MHELKEVYSIVIPVYNSEDIVSETVDQIVNFMRGSGHKFEIVLVNDGSTDTSWEVIRHLPDSFPEVVSIDLLRNSGQHTAVFCGIAHARGDYIITMDDDLQNPPPEIGKLIGKIHEGYDLVFAQFEQKQHSLFRRLGSIMVGYLNHKVFNKPKDLILTNFRIFTAEVAKRMLRSKVKKPYIPGELLKAARNCANVTTLHSPRLHGKSNYTIYKILALLARLLFSYSSFPLRLLSRIGGGVALLSLMLGTFFLVRSLFVDTETAGWASLIVMISFLQGLIILMLGIVGEYLAKLLNQMSEESPYEVVEVVRND